MPTKRKRRSKHRGTAAGTIEARGRTGRRPTADEQKKLTRDEARQRRLDKPPSWNSAAVKAAVMAFLLFIFTQLGLFGDETPIEQSLLLAAFAMVLYTPLAYATDKWVYNRAQRKKAEAAAGKRKG
jgi:quinol-cytochrome oxidoreductase complex cytochrome b subunit